MIRRRGYVKCTLAAVLVVNLCYPNISYAEDNYSDSSSEFAQSQDSSSTWKNEDGDASKDIPADDSIVEDEVFSSISDDEIERVVAQSSGIETNGYNPINTSSLLASSSSKSVEEYSGAELYDTAAAQSAGAFASSEYAIVVGRGGWPDALSATSLAGVYRCPILFTEKDSVPAATASELARLGVSHILLVGGPNLVSQGGLDALGSATGAEVERIWGESLFDTQMAVYERGAGQWSGDLVIVATGADFPDALSIAPVAYAKKAPVFLVSGGGLLPEQKTALMDAARSGSFANAAIAGGTNVVSEATEGFMDAVTVLASGRTGGCVRLAGAELYDTSAAVAEWAVSTQGFSWAAPAFATGRDSYDALAGSVLQGESGSVLLLVDDPQDATVRTAASHAGDVSSVRFFGGRNVVHNNVRNAIITELIGSLIYTDFDISLNAMSDLEVEASKGYQNYSKTEILESLNPDNFSYNQSTFYQFARINGGYSGKVSADQLSAFIAQYGSNGKLAGMGSAFIEAAQTYGVNEVYLLSHAILESDWGRSQLAMGFDYEGGYIDGSYYPAGRYYNFFGIGAYDNSPLSGGRKMAVIQGWSTPRNAILGAAKWVSNNYVLGSWSQDSLYKMKWNVSQAANENTVWHQYATGRTWATGIANVMSDCYRFIGLEMATSGLLFDVPQYR